PIQTKTTTAKPTNQSETASKAAAKDAGPKLEQPPILSPLPSNPQLSERGKEKLDKAFKNYANDQVSAYLTFREVMEDKRANLNSEQQKWLQDTMIILKPRAVAVLNRDLNAARAKADFRSAYITLL